MRILVLSTFDVWPPRDGGQNRYVNLWCNFSPEHEITILVYDFRNLAGERRYRLAKHVEVIVPPASYGDARHFSHMQSRTGLWLHDVLCLADYQFSAAFLRRMGEAVRHCDVLVAAHPYLAPLAFPIAPARVLKVYESYNVEFDIKHDYFKSGRGSRLADLLTTVADGERYASAHADLVTAVSETEAGRLSQLYGIDTAKLTIIPNGANIRAQDLLGTAERRHVREHLGVSEELVGIFLGSSFPANVESYRRGRDMLEAAGFKGTMLLVGSIDQATREDWPRVTFQERWFGFVESEVKDILLAASDFALHLIFSGAGTNLKLFEYMGAGTPIITNVFGRRGVQADNWNWPAETAQELAISLNSICKDRGDIAHITATARELGMKYFDWHSIAGRFCADLTLRHQSPCLSLIAQNSPRSASKRIR